MDEDESAYPMRINEAVYRCGNIHIKEEKMSIFVDRLQTELSRTVAGYLEAEPRHEMTLQRLVHHAQNEGDALCARISESERNSKRRQAAFAATPCSTQNTQRQVAILEQTPVGKSDSKRHQVEGLFSLQDDMDDGSIRTQDLPSTITDFDLAEEQDQILMFTRNLRDN